MLLSAGWPAAVHQKVLAGLLSPDPFASSVWGSEVQREMVCAGIEDLSRCSNQRRLFLRYHSDRCNII